MPKEFTHWFVADNIRSRVSAGPVAEVINRHLPLYFLGAVIPDTPYYALMSKAPVRVAENLHDSTLSFFAGGPALAEAEADGWCGEAAAFLLGVYTHLFADAVFHPLVYYYSGIRNHIRHRRFESLLDLIFMRASSGSLPRDMMSLVQSISTEEEKILKWTESLFSPYGNMEHAVVRRLLRSHGRFHRRFLSRPWCFLFRAAAGLIPSAGMKQVDALFYPRLEPRFPVPETAVPYRHPVTDESGSHTPGELLENVWKRFRGLTGLFGEHPHDPRFLASALKEFPVANLTTGLTGRRTEEMRHFDLGRPVLESLAPFFRLDGE